MRSLDTNCRTPVFVFKLFYVKSDKEGKKREGKERAFGFNKSGYYLCPFA